MQTELLYARKRLEDSIYVKYGLLKYQFDKLMFDLKMEESKEIIEWKEANEREKKSKQD
jgi:hypothetical protein